MTSNSLVALRITVWTAKFWSHMSFGKHTGVQTRENWCWASQLVRQTGLPHETEGHVCPMLQALNDSRKMPWLLRAPTQVVGVMVRKFVWRCYHFQKESRHSLSSVIRQLKVMLSKYQILNLLRKTFEVISSQAFLRVLGPMAVLCPSLSFPHENSRTITPGRVIHGKAYMWCRGNSGNTCFLSTQRSYLSEYQI